MGIIREQTGIIREQTGIIRRLHEKLIGSLFLRFAWITAISSAVWSNTGFCRSPPDNGISDHWSLLSLNPDWADSDELGSGGNMTFTSASETSGSAIV